MEDIVWADFLFKFAILKNKTNKKKPKQTKPQAS